MRFGKTFLLVMTLALAFPATLLAKEQLRIACTNSVVKTGLLPELANIYCRKHDILINWDGASTGAVLKRALSGNYDLVIVHGRELEENFIAGGWGISRKDVAKSRFLILGPANDPAGIRGMKDAADAFRKIALKNAGMVTRSVVSGTSEKEAELWEAAGIIPKGNWYQVSPEGDKGSQETLRFASNRQAYVLVDFATYSILSKEILLVPLVENDPRLEKIISVIELNPAKFSSISSREAREFAEWLTGQEAQGIISRFGIDKYGHPLFSPAD